MGRARCLTPAQLADAIARERSGHRDTAAMSNQQRRDAGLMDLGQAAEHERLVTLPHARLADRTRGQVPDDIWAVAGGDSDAA